jgi:hypothetical protein
LRSHASDPCHTDAPGRRPTRKTPHAAGLPAIPGTRLTPHEVLALQRLAGNAATVRRLAEHDHDRRHNVQRTAVHQALRSAGRPLEERTQAEMESRLGTDFSDVRVHTDATAHAAAESVQAHAFTSGSHIVFQRGRYDTTSSAGKHMLAHELTHVMQQRSGPVAGADVGNGFRVSDPADAFERAAETNAKRAMSIPVRSTPVQPARTAARGDHHDAGAIQRDVGFEIEVGAESYAFAPPLKKDEGYTGKRRLVTPLASHDWKPRRLHTPGQGGSSTRRGLFRPPSMSRSLTKGTVLVESTDFSIQADEASTGGSNVEFVTVPFPETDDGRARLVSALARIVAVQGLFNGEFHPADTLAKVAGGGTVNRPSDLPPSEGGKSYDTAEYVVAGFGGKGNPQATAGIPLERLASLVQAMEVRQPATGALAGMRLAGADAHHVMDEAEKGVAALPQPAGLSNPPSQRLRGLLVLIASYLRHGARRTAGQRVTESYYKGIAAMLARTDFASMFALLPDDERMELAASNAAVLIELALTAAKLDPATEADEPVLEAITPPGRRVNFGELTRRRWLEGIPAGRDLLSRAGYEAFAQEAAGQAQGFHPGKAAEFESMGSLGNKMDGEGNTRAPILELRRLPQNVPTAMWGPLLLKVFDVVRTVNAGNTP